MSKMITRIAVLLLVWVGAYSVGRCQEGSSAILTITGTEVNNATGSITIVVNGVSETVAFGQYSTAASIAAGFGAYFSAPPFASVPPLCTSGICAKAIGSAIVFQFEGGTHTPTVSWSSTSGSPFQVDTSQWSSPTTPLMTLSCTPNAVIVGSTVSCTASLPAGTAGTVNFTVDGNAAAAIAIDNNGNAVATGLLSGAALGSHLVKASYQASNNAASSAYLNVQVEAGSNSTSVVYYYSITTQPGSSPPGLGQSGYAANGNVTAYSDSVNGHWTLGYDSFDRLTSSTQGAMGSGVSTYGCWSYDSFGNRTTQAFSNQAIQAECQSSSGSTSYFATTMQFADGTNRITARGTINANGTAQSIAAPSYDNVGNTVQDQTIQYTYDGQGHVCAAHTAQGMIGYIYDAEGHRVAKGTITSMSCDPSSNGFAVTTVYELGFSGQPMTEVDGGSWLHTDVYAVGQQIATYDSNGVHFQLHDWLGSRRVQTNAVGAIEDTCSSNPYGDGQSCSNAAMDVSDRHFTGRERDTESGLDYFGARYYASNMGRWTSPDWSVSPVAVPYAIIANPQTLNLYRYVANNPLGGTDVDGHHYMRSDPYQTDVGGQMRSDFLALDLAYADAAAKEVEEQQQNQASQQNNQQAQQQTTSAAGVAFIEGWEGWNGTVDEKTGLTFAKDDGFGNGTIGWGHNCGKCKDFKDGITKEQGETLLKSDLAGFEKSVNGLGASLSQQQFDGLVSFAFNVRNYGSSTLFGNAASGTAVTEENFTAYGHAHVGGKLVEVPSLMTRRRSEYNIYANGVYDSSH